MRHTAFDLDQDSTIVSILAVRQPHRAGWTTRQALAVTILTASGACLVFLHLNGVLPWQ